MRPLFYFICLGGTVVALGCLAIGLAVAVDPYRMYGTAAIPKWTALKPQIYNQIELAKTYQIERIRPATLLLGNSRVEVGFDPESPHWPAGAYPGFNAAVAGRNLSTSLLMLREAIAAQPPDTVILGLDITDFLQKPDVLSSCEERTGPDERRLLIDRDGHSNSDRPLQLWRDRIATTLTIDATLDALATPFDQNSETSTTMTPLGFNPMNEYRVFVARQGHYRLFAQKNAIYRQQFQHYPAPDFRDPLSFDGFRCLQAIMSLIAARQKLVLFIHPYHADYLDMLRELGLWDSFENWKRALTKLVAMEGRHRNVALYDCSGYNRFSTEPVPARGDRRTIMRWYWEAGHYKAALGNEMLDSMLGGADRFGFVLKPTTVEQVLAEIRESRKRFTIGDPPKAR